MKMTRRRTLVVCIMAWCYISLGVPALWLDVPGVGAWNPWRLIGLSGTAMWELMRMAALLVVCTSAVVALTSTTALLSSLVVGALGMQSTASSDGLDGSGSL